MTLGQKLKQIRRECGLSQEALGAQGFVSAPGWIKIENNQRFPSEKLIDALLNWLAADKHIRASAVKGLREELLTLKYLGSPSPFLSALARTHAGTLSNGEALLTPNHEKPKRGRPKLLAPR